jgi:hypothetical protein
MTLDDLRQLIDTLDLGFREIAESEGSLWEEPRLTLRRETRRCGRVGAPNVLASPRMTAIC